MPYDHLYAGGWFAPSSADTLAVENPATERAFESVPRGLPADVDRAVEAATKALPSWAEIDVSERAQYLHRFAAELIKAADHTAEVIVAELGMPYDATLSVQATEPGLILASYADAISEIQWRETIQHSLVIRRPVGVVAAITPWNYPLYQIACKAGAALAAGCTVVLKPSELTPLNAFAFVEAADRAGLPAGVVNLVTGLGSEVGEALVAHRNVDAVSFTGSTATGRRIAGLAAEQTKRSSLELGGKSAAVVLGTADLETAVRASVRNCMRNSGQSCSAQTRLLVPRRVLAAALEIAAQAANSIELGDPTEHGDHLGPLVSSAQLERVLGYIRAGEASTAKLVAGGSTRPAGIERGYYVQPTVFGDVDPHSRLAQDEIFGPVLSVIGYDTLEEATALANGTPYGLSAGVWAGSDEEAYGFAASLLAGEVTINGAPFNVAAPFGGVRASGYGRELGRYGVEEFTTPLAIHLPPESAVLLPR